LLITEKKEEPIQVFAVQEDLLHQVHPKRRYKFTNWHRAIPSADILATGMNPSFS